MKKEILAIAGSMFRLSITALIGVVIGHGSIYEVNWKEALGAGGFAAVMVLYNYFNPQNKNYGKGSEDQNKAQ